MPAPSVTLALPAYNEAAYLERTVASLLGQTYTDFELILGDNASTDRTPALMEALAKSDSRIRLLPAAKNVGAVANFARLLAAARGEYFAWVGAHDYYHPEWLASLISAISADARLVLAYPRCCGLLPDHRTFDLPHFSVNSRKWPLRARVRTLATFPAAGTRIYGLMRTCAAQACPVITTIRWDTLFLARLGVWGDFVSVDQPLWYRLYDTPPEEEVTPESFERALVRHFRTIYPPDAPAPFWHRLPHAYHLLCWLREAVRLLLRGQCRRAWLMGVAMCAYHRKNKKTLRHEWPYFRRWMWERVCNRRSGA